jgi:hypothetical protein
MIVTIPTLYVAAIAVLVSLLLGLFWDARYKKRLHGPKAG